jgi:hypothetical protein
VANRPPALDSERAGKTGKQTNEQTNKQTDRQTDRQTRYAEIRRPKSGYASSEKDMAPTGKQACRSLHGGKTSLTDRMQPLTRFLFLHLQTSDSRLAVRCFTSALPLFVLYYMPCYFMLLVLQLHVLVSFSSADCPFAESDQYASTRKNKAPIPDQPIAANKSLRMA